MSTLVPPSPESFTNEWLYYNKMHWAGTWSATTTYNSQDLVARNNVGYISLVPLNIGNDPATSPAFWVPLPSQSAPPPSADWLTLANAPVWDARRYNFAPQSPGGTLTGGISNTIPWVPTPGVQFNDTAHYLYISGGVGAAEAVLITGGSNSTLTFTPANNHSGAWTISSATAGIQEAKQAAGSAGGIVQLTAGTLTTYATIYIDTPIWLRGSSINASKISIAAQSPHVVQIHHDHVVVSDLYIDSSAGGRTGNGIELDSGFVEGRFDNLRVYNQSIGIDLNGAGWVSDVWMSANATGLRINSNEVHVRASQSNQNTSNGVVIAGGTGIYLVDFTAAGNSVSNFIATGSPADIQMIGCVSSMTTSGPGLDFSAATTAELTITNMLVETSGGNAPAIKLGDITGLRILGSVITAANASPGIVFTKTAYEVNITGNKIEGGGSTTTAIDLSGASNAAWIVITGNTMKTWTTGLAAGSNLAANGVVLAGNYFSVTTPVSGSLNGSVQSVLTANFWGAGPNTYASAATVNVKPYDEVVFITGTTQIVIVGGDLWRGRRLTLIFTDAAPGGLGAGGNIAAARTVAQNGSITLVGAQSARGMLWY